MTQMHGHLLTTTGHIINLGDDWLETQPPPLRHVDKVLNNTLDDENTHHGWLMEISGVATMWTHQMCIVHSNHSMVLYEEHRLP